MIKERNMAKNGLTSVKKNYGFSAPKPIKQPKKK